MTFTHILGIFISFILSAHRNDGFRIRAGSDPFGDDMDDHFEKNGGNLVNLVEEGDEKLPTVAPPPPPMTTTSSLIDEDVGTTVDAVDDPDAEKEESMTTTTTNLIENDSASSNETSPLEKKFESVSFDAVNASQAGNGKGVSSELVKTSNINVTDVDATNDDVHHEIVKDILDLAEDKNDFVSKVTRNGTDVFAKEKFVSDNGFVVMGADGNTTREEKGTMDGKKVKVKLKKAVHFQIMGNNDEKWHEAHENNSSLKDSNKTTTTRIKNDDNNNNKIHNNNNNNSKNNNNNKNKINNNKHTTMSLLPIQS